MLRLFFVTVMVLAAQGFMEPMEVRANERTIDVSIYGRDDAYEKQVDGKQLFGNGVFPGSAETSVLRIHNETDADLYYRWECRSEGANRDLFKALCLRLRSSRGAILYDGPLEDLQHIGGPLKSGNTVRFLPELYLPAETDNMVTGSQADFEIIISFAAGLFSENQKSGKADGLQEETDAVRESQAALKKTAERTRRSGSGSGSGGSVSPPGTYAVYDPSGSTSGSRLLHERKDESGNPLVISSYDREGITAPRSGFAFGGAVIGGGERRTYAAPDPLLLKGIDDGIWVLTDPEKQQWKYCFEDGTYLKGGFALVRNRNSADGASFRWFYFNEDGIMMVGWIRTDPATWYYARNVSDGDLGALETGWIISSEDGALYYTNEQTAVMMSGWIGFKNSTDGWDYSYFARLEDTYRQNWFFNTLFGRWIYDRLGHRCYGSMYVDEITPDLSRVDIRGRKIS